MFNNIRLYRIRINIEEKAKVLADVWGTEFIKFLAVAVLHWDNLKNRKNCTRKS